MSPHILDFIIFVGLSQSPNNTLNNLPKDKDVEKNVEAFFTTLSQLPAHEILGYDYIASVFNRINIQGNKKNLGVGFIYNKINNFIEEFKKDVYNK